MKPIQKGDYVLATKWPDGDPQDHWAIGFYEGQKKDRYFVIDNDGKQLRLNGFRRIQRISKKRGNWLLMNSKAIESSMHSLWYWSRFPIGKERNET